MKSTFLSFLRQLLIFTAVLMISGLLLFFILPRQWFSVTVPFLFFFFLSSTLVSYNILLRSFQERFSRFLNVFLITTIAKLALYVTVILLYVFLNRADALPFLIAFFVLYICYTIFEVVKLVSYTKNTKPGKESS